MEGAHLIFTEQKHSEWKWVREGEKREGEGGREGEGEEARKEKHRLKQNAELRDGMGPASRRWEQLILQMLMRQEGAGTCSPRVWRSVVARTATNEPLGS